MGVTDIFDPRQNIMGGARYLQVLARRFCKTQAAGDAGTAHRLLARREGEGRSPATTRARRAVEKYGGIPPYETTHAYVAMVLTPVRPVRGRRRERTADQN